MRTLFLIFCMLLVLGGCSKQNPVIEKKEVVVQEDKRNISELRALSLLDQALSPEALRDELIRISQFHKLDFKHQDFWKSLRYPAFDITKINENNIEVFGLIATGSCSSNDSEAFVQFLLYLNTDLKVNLKDQILKLVSAHLNQCSPSYSLPFYKLFLKEINSIQLEGQSSDSIKHVLNILKFLAIKNDKSLNKELGVIVSRKMIREVSRYIIAKEDLDLAIFFSALIKSIHPLNQKLSLIPLNDFVGTTENISKLVKTLSFDELSFLLKKLHDKLPFDGNSVKPFIAEYLNKSEEFYLNGEVDTKIKSDYLDSLQEAYEIFSAYNKDLVVNLDMVNSLSEKALNVLKTSSDLDIAEKISESSLIASTILAKRLTSAEFTGVLLPRERDSVHEAAAKIFTIKKNNDHATKLKFKIDYCKLFKTKNLHTLNEVLGSGCYVLKNSSRSILVNEPINHSFFSVVDIDADKLSLKGGKSKTGVINLSSQHVYEDVKTLVTPHSHDAVVIPLLISVHAESKKGIFLKGANYYFFYHWVYSTPMEGVSPDEGSLPLSGVNGGSLYVSEENANINFISSGSEGQKAPAPAKGGNGYTFKFDENSFEAWISDFIDFDSYLLVQNDKTKDNLNTLFKIAKRNEDKRIISYLDPNYIGQLLPEAQLKIDESLDLVNKKNDWGCSTRECILKKVAEMAMSEFSSLVTLGEMDKLLTIISPEFKIENGSQGPVISDGQRGKNGKIFISNAY